MSATTWRGTDLPAEPLEVRPARLSDLPEFQRVYLAQNADDRHFYHPLPFGTIRLWLLLRTLVGLRPLTQMWPRILPRATAIIFIARSPGHGPIVCLGTIRFRRERDGVLAAETGYFVAPAFRRHHFGTRFKRGLVDYAYALGARRILALIHPDNAPSIALNRRLGAEIRRSPEPDRRAPGEARLMAVIELPDPPMPTPTVRALSPVETEQSRV